MEDNIGLIALSISECFGSEAVTRDLSTSLQCLLPGATFLRASIRCGTGLFVTDNLLRPGYSMVTLVSLKHSLAGLAMKQGSPLQMMTPASGAWPGSVPTRLVVVVPVAIHAPDGANYKPLQIGALILGSSTHLTDNQRIGIAKLAAAAGPAFLTVGFAKLQHLSHLMHLRDSDAQYIGAEELMQDLPMDVGRPTTYVANYYGTSYSTTDDDSGLDDDSREENDPMLSLPTKPLDLNVAVEKNILVMVKKESAQSDKITRRPSQSTNSIRGVSNKPVTVSNNRNTASIDTTTNNNNDDNNNKLNNNDDQIKVMPINNTNNNNNNNKLQQQQQQVDEQFFNKGSGGGSNDDDDNSSSSLTKPTTTMINHDKDTDDIFLMSNHSKKHITTTTPPPPPSSSSALLLTSNNPYMEYSYTSSTATMHATTDAIFCIMYILTMSCYYVIASPALLLHDHRSYVWISLLFVASALPLVGAMAMLFSPSSSYARYYSRYREALLGFLLLVNSLFARRSRSAFLLSSSSMDTTASASSIETFPDVIFVAAIALGCRIRFCWLLPLQMINVWSVLMSAPWAVASAGSVVGRCMLCALPLAIARWAEKVERQLLHSYEWSVSRTSGSSGCSGKVMIDNDDNSSRRHHQLNAALTVTTGHSS